MSRLLSPSPILQREGLGLIRIVVGILMCYHGSELFRPDVMQEYMQWDMFNSGMGNTMVYVGKAAELTAGSLLVLGLLTRVGAIIAIGTFCYISFIIGHGKVWYDDQHPFLFVLLALIFFFNGPGAWSLDEKTFKKQR